MSNKGQSRNQRREDLLQDFFIQAEEWLDTFEQDLLKLEAIAQADYSLIQPLLATLAELKTEAEKLALDDLAQCATEGETCLEALKRGDTDVSASTMNALFKTSDTLKALLAKLKDGTTEKPSNVTPLPLPAPASQSLSARAFYEGNSMVIQVAGQNLSTETLGQARVDVKGETLSIRVPLAPTSMQAVLAEVSGMRIAVPVAHTLEVCRLKDGLELPRINVADILGLQETACLYGIVVRVGQTTAVLAVNQLLGQDEVEVKPLSENNTATTPDGAECTLLDVAALLKKGRA